MTKRMQFSVAISGWIELRGVGVNPVLWSLLCKQTAGKNTVRKVIFASLNFN